MGQKGGEGGGEKWLWQAWGVGSGDISVGTWRPMVTAVAPAGGGVGRNLCSHPVSLGL